MKTGMLRNLLLAFGLCFGLAAQSPSPEDATCLGCHGERSFSKTDGNGREVSLFVDWKVFKNSIHAGNGCTSCHADLAENAHPGDQPVQKASCAACHGQAQETYDRSAHGLLHKAGNGQAASCADCHGAHTIQPMSDPASPVNRANQTATCAKCHGDIVKEYTESTHGQAVARGVKEAPSCIDCHNEHQIEDLRGASPRKIADQVCSHCHGSTRMNSKFGMPDNRVSTFQDSYHGLAARLGSTEAANCASCHGFHRILPSSDPQSLVHPSNLIQTCGQCHPGASERFVAGKIHLDPNDQNTTGEKVNRWTRLGYLSLIYLVIGGMVVHNLIGWWRKAQKSRLDPDRTVVRMNLLARVQHAILALSFIWLVISGFALVWPDSWLGWLVGNSEAFRRISHRVAAVAMMALGLAHIVFVVFTKDGRKFVKDMWPERKDVYDVLRYFGHMLRPGTTPAPRFKRFGYAEKAEYWAVVWGTLIMGATGLMLWAKVWITQWLPRWWVDIATTIHLYEAILATLAIIIWHFYFVIFDPDVYPINWAWLDGRMNRDHYAHEHPLDVQEGAEDSEGDEGTEAEPPAEKH